MPYIEFLRMKKKSSDMYEPSNYLIICFIPQAKIETRALKAKRPGLSGERYNETEYYIENGKPSPS